MALSRSTTRRQFLQAAAAATAGSGFLGWTSLSRGDASRTAAPVRQLTRGPKHHWFAYYDKLEFDPTDRYVLTNEVDFEHRSPRPDDVIRIGMVDLADGDRWIELGSSRSWCWQQGCMLQWRPGSASEILWNDRQGDRYVCRILDVKTKKKRTLEHPIYSVSPDGRWAIAPDFSRLNDVRPGYGYAGLPDPNHDALAPRDTGIFRVDLDTGEQKLLLSLADVARLPHQYGDLSKMKHWFNHLLVNPDGSRFTFLHRWTDPKKQGIWGTRMLTAAADGSQVRVLIDSGFVSHFIWRDPDHILAYSQMTPQDKRGFFLVGDKPNRTVEQIAKEVTKGDGHCVYLPDKRWMLYDSYPDRQRLQHLYLYDVAQKRRVELGAFRLPKEYRGEWRCDLHPRFSRDGRSIVIDSPHTGQGRQLHLVDISRAEGAAR